MALMAVALPVSTGDYSQYWRNLGPDQYQFGFTRGNENHRIGHQQLVNGPHFETKVAIFSFVIVSAV